MGREAALIDGENIVGRGPESVLWLEDDTVSRAHARIRIALESATLEDLSSKNGTFLRGRRIEACEPLQDGDEIRVGDVPLRFRGQPPSGKLEWKRTSPVRLDTPTTTAVPSSMDSIPPRTTQTSSRGTGGGL
ncbi:MAG: FHA domain-containing protein [Acidobacteriota bacterium]